MRPQHPESLRGSVLVYVVLVIMLLSVFATSVASQAAAAVDLSDRLLAQMRAAYLARAAVVYAARVVDLDATPASDGFTDLWSHHPSVFDRHPLAGGTFTVIGEERAGASRYGLSDEERRVPLNTAPAEVLARLVQVAGGLSDRQAAEVAAAIEDWRDEDSTQRMDGAEDFFYQSLQDGYDCKDGPFESVEELLLVKGVSPSLYQALEPHVTVYGSGHINLNTAGEIVLRALGLSEVGVAGVLTFRAGEDNELGTSDDRQLVSVAALGSELAPYVPAEDLARLTALASDKLLGVQAEAFRMTIQAESGDAASRITALCVIDRQGKVKLWAER